MIYYFVTSYYLLDSLKILLEKINEIKKKICVSVKTKIMLDTFTKYMR